MCGHILRSSRRAFAGDGGEEDSGEDGWEHSDGASVEVCSEDGEHGVVARATHSQTPWT